MFSNKGRTITERQSDILKESKEKFIELRETVLNNYNFKTLSTKDFDILIRESFTKHYEFLIKHLDTLNTHVQDHLKNACYIAIDSLWNGTQETTWSDVQRELLLAESWFGYFLTH